MMSMARTKATFNATRSPISAHNVLLSGRFIRAAAFSRCLSSSQPDTDLLISKSEGLLTIKLNRPSKLNSIKHSMYQGIADVLNEAAKDPAVQMVLLSGSGKYYSAGVDLSSFDGFADAAHRAELLQGMMKHLETFLTSMIDFPKPIVAGVNGPAMGIMFTTLAMVDIVWCSSGATFSAPFVVNSQSPEGCSSKLFPVTLGRSLANEVLMLNRKLDAKEALERGLVSRIITGDDFLERVTKELKEAIANYSTESMAATKSLVFDQKTRDELKAVMGRENNVLCQRMMSQEFLTFISKFMTKNKKKE